MTTKGYRSLMLKHTFDIHGSMSAFQNSRKVEIAPWLLYSAFLKALLPQKRRVSVQFKPESDLGYPGNDVEFYSNCRRFFFRVALELVSAKPCFIAYYPGEPYFYCDTPNPPGCVEEASYRLYRITDKSDIF